MHVWQLPRSMAGFWPDTLTFDGEHVYVVGYYASGKATIAKLALPE